MVEKWNRVDSRGVADYRIFQVRQDTSRSPLTGRLSDFWVLEMAQWVNIIPLTPAGKVVLIRQYRHGIQEVCLEIPGGIAEEKDGPPAVAARRELIEETGYEVEKVIPIGRVSPNPAIQNNQCHSFLGLGAYPAGKQQLEGTEDISLEEVGLEEIPGLIVSGQIKHALVIVAFYLFEQFRKENPACLREFYP